MIAAAVQQRATLPERQLAVCVLASDCLPMEELSAWFVTYCHTTTACLKTVCELATTIAVIPAPSCNAQHLTYKRATKQCSVLVLLLLMSAA